MGQAQPPRDWQPRTGFGQLVCWLWASPASFIGICAAASGFVTGGTIRRVGPTWEVWGGVVTRLLSSRWIRARGMTLGHVILGTSPNDLDVVRSHEWVHVRQYERWGPFFIPTYLACSAYLYLCGRDGYLDNPFEVEAYDDDRRRESTTTP